MNLKQAGRAVALCAVVAVASLPAAKAQASDNAVNQMKDEPFKVKLLSPISTVNSHAGDSFSAAVVEPARFQGDIVGGKITKVQSSKAGFGNGKSSILFVFDTLQSGGRTLPISAVLEDVSNSKGVKNVDEEGQVIGKSSNKKRIGATAGGALGGALLGAALGGTGGALAGMAAGGAAGFLIATEMTTTGSQIAFQPGSVFSLKVSTQNERTKQRQ